MIDRECYICKTTRDIQAHHVFFGSGYRKLSDNYGMVVDLCMSHHTGPQGVHFNRALDLRLKREFQDGFEKSHTREEFMKIFGRNYLE